MLDFPAACASSEIACLMSAEPIWTHPRIESPFIAANDRHGIARAAFHALVRREEQYPTLIDNGLIGKAEAAADIAAWRAIADDWEWIACGPAEPVPAAEFWAHRCDRERLAALTLRDRVSALDWAIERFFEHYDELLRRTPTAQELVKHRRQITLLAAMRTWAERELRPDTGPNARLYSGMTHHIRAQLRDEQHEERNAA